MSSHVMSCHISYHMSYHISYHIISHQFKYHIDSYIISYIISYGITSYQLVQLWLASGNYLSHDGWNCLNNNRILSMLHICCSEMCEILLRVFSHIPEPTLKGNHVCENKSHYVPIIIIECRSDGDNLLLDMYLLLTSIVRFIIK